MYLKENVGYCIKLQYVDDRGYVNYSVVKLVVLTTKGVLFTAEQVVNEMQEDFSYEIHPVAYYNATVNGRPYTGRVARTVYKCLLHRARFDNLNGGLGMKAVGFYEPEDENIFANYQSQLFYDYVEQLKRLQAIIIDHAKYYSQT